MSRIVRALAVSGAAAAALMGTATAATADSTEAAVATVEAAAHRAASAPVSLPDGRVLHVRGLDTVSYRADAAHHSAVVTLADGAPGQMPGNDVAPQGVGSQIGTGLQQQPQQVQTQAGAGSISTVAVAALVLGVITFFGIKAGKLAKGWFVVSLALGVLLSGTLIGPLVSQLTGSGVTAFGNIWAGM
ncbi:hypothetical protein [Streptomyces californicus]|uniref:hypothetical protein n=1 Tax=Streptomyces californicus TaxID=67351 RepID=UPI003328F16A